MTDSYELSQELIDAGVRLLELPEDQIFTTLGSQVYPTPWAGLVPGKEIKPTIAELSRKGRDWFAKNRTSLKRKICVEWDYCSKKKKYNSSREIIQAVAPVVGGAIGVSAGLAGIAVTVTTLLMKMGLDSFCDCK